VMRTGDRWRQRCIHGQTMDSHGPPGHGGEDGCARTTAVDGAAARGRQWLSERFFPTSLAGDSGSRLLLHIEGVMAMWVPGLVGDNGGQRWPTMWSRAVAKSEVEQKRHGRRKEKGEGNLLSTR
jgi:hypothetical protein